MSGVSLPNSADWPAIEPAPAATYTRLRLLRSAGDRKVPAAANSDEPKPEAEDRARNRHRGRREPQRGADHHNGRTGQGGDGVKIGA